jgi:hypothetical protein
LPAFACSSREYFQQQKGEEQAKKKKKKQGKNYKLQTLQNKTKNQN